MTHRVSGVSRVAAASVTSGSPDRDPGAAPHRWGAVDTPPGETRTSLSWRR